MTLDADLILDRARLKRRLTIWRIVAVVAIVLAVFVVTFPPRRAHDRVLPRPTSSRYRITGLIGDGTTAIRALDRLGADATVLGRAAASGYARRRGCRRRGHP